MKVLLADDSALILSRLEEMLVIYKQVEIVGSLKNGKDALIAVKDRCVDLVIADLNMPGLTGLEVLKEIRKENNSVKFIILTFYSSDQYRDLAMTLGADYFFSKVDDFEKLSLVVADMILEEIRRTRSKLEELQIL